MKRFQATRNSSISPQTACESCSKALLAAAFSGKAAMNNMIFKSGPASHAHHLADWFIKVLYFVCGRETCPRTGCSLRRTNTSSPVGGR